MLHSIHEKFTPTRNGRRSKSCRSFPAFQDLLESSMYSFLSGQPATESYLFLWPMPPWPLCVLTWLVSLPPSGNHCEDLGGGPWLSLLPPMQIQNKDISKSTSWEGKYDFWFLLILRGRLWLQGCCGVANNEPMGQAPWGIIVRKWTEVLPECSSIPNR